ncbi:MAG: histidinol dehydrogenase, partial [Vicinamibacterales bacterium]
WLARDLRAQAEHAPDARANFVPTRRARGVAVAVAVGGLMPADGPARTAIRRHGAVVVARTRREALQVVQRLAPEHLVVDSADDVPAATAAGTVFVGEWSVQAAGDYATGSNHVLPTGGAARVRGGLTTADFMRTYTVQTLTRAGLRRIAPAAETLAHAEGLTLHAASIAARRTKKTSGGFFGEKATRRLFRGVTEDTQ